MSSEPPPWAQPAAAPPPLSRRRVVLLVVAALLVVALVVAALTLRSALEAVVASDETATVTDVEVDLDDCADQFPDWVDGLIETESARIVQVYGTGPVTSTPYRHPDGFPTIAVTWAGVVPNCGTTLVIPGDIGVAYYLDALESSRSEFEALSSVLTALGYVMTADQGARELLEVDAGPAPGASDAPSPGPIEADEPGTEEPGADEPGTGEPETGDGEGTDSEVSAYRYFRLSDGSRMWVQFDPVDADDPDGAGDLYLGYFPAT